MYMVFDDESKFNEWHNDINLFFGYPNEKTKTLRYTQCIPNKLNSKVCCVVKKNIPPQFDGEKFEVSKIIEDGFIGEMLGGDE